MKTKELTNKELNLLIDGLYARFSDEQLENNPNSIAAKLMDKLFEAKEFTKSDTNSILHK